MKYLIAVGRLAVHGTERCEIGNFLVELTNQIHTDPELAPLIQDVDFIPISQCPTDTARNKLVQTAQERGVDILFCVDDDAAPPTNWFKTAFQFLIAQPIASVIGCPYVTLNGEVPIFEWQSIDAAAGNVQPSFALAKIGREDAARRSGIQPCANLGTHCVAYDMRVFDTIPRPYYQYSYNEHHTLAIESEDNVLHRKLWFGGTPLFVSWDHWSDHYKMKRLGKPWVVGREEVERMRDTSIAADKRKGKYSTVGTNGVLLTTAP